MPTVLAAHTELLKKEPAVPDGGIARRRQRLPGKSVGTIRGPDHGSPIAHGRCSETGQWTFGRTAGQATGLPQGGSTQVGGTHVGGTQVGGTNGQTPDALSNVHRGQSLQ